MPSSGIFGRNLLGTFGLGAPNQSGAVLIPEADAVSSLHAVMVQAIAFSAETDATSGGVATVGEPLFVTTAGASSTAQAGASIFLTAEVDALSGLLLSPYFPLTAEVDALSGASAPVSLAALLALAAATSSENAGLGVALTAESDATTSLSLAPYLSVTVEADALSGANATYTVSAALYAVLAALSAGDINFAVQVARTISFTLGAPRAGDSLEGPF